MDGGAERQSTALLGATPSGAPAPPGETARGSAPHWDASRWLAGVFDPNGRVDGSRAAAALAPHAASALDSGPLHVAYSGPSIGRTHPLCLFDGHLDNAAEIQATLNESHTEGAHEAPEALLAAAYRRWGADLLAQLRGDFVVLIWDRERGQGLLARDQLGVRPCFLHDAGGPLRFANEVRHLLALLPRRPAPDPTSVAHWVAVSNRPGADTLYSGVRRLRPGSVLLLSSGGWREEEYWAPRFEEPLDLPPAELAASMREQLARAVRRRIDARSTTGVTMSGGLDSSSVAALCAEDADGRVCACSATFPEHPAADETELIGQLTRALAVPSLRAEVRPGGVLASALESLAAWELPLRSWGDFWALPLLRAAAQAGVGTVLGGDGGDELFEARVYLPADRLRAGHPLDALALARALPGAGPRPPRRQVARAYGSLALLGALPYRAHRSLQAPRAARELPTWLRPEAAQELLRSDDPLAWKRLDGPRWWAHAAHGLTRRIEEGGVFEHHRRRAALAGVQSRHPLLDLDLVAFGLRQPPSATFDCDLSRPVLRASMAGLLPDAVRLRPQKALFESVIADCLRGPDRAAVWRLLGDPRAELGAYVELAEARRALLDTDTEYRRSPFRWMWQVWRMVTAELWLRAQSDASNAHVAALGASPARVEIRPGPPSYLFPP
jgi:asparagine synthase (glutamine-hydrolysing)